jgi:hypothetical protein
MSAKESCLTCKFCRERASPSNPKQKATMCLRYPPTALAVPVQHPLTQAVSVAIQSVHPPVGVDEWCGEYQPGLAILAGPANN